MQSLQERHSRLKEMFMRDNEEMFQRELKSIEIHFDAIQNPEKYPGYNSVNPFVMR